MDIGELKIGYGFTDFVVEDGTIEAALAVREEKMETIRVLIKTSGYANSVHQAVELFADCDCRIWNVESELATLEKVSVLSLRGILRCLIRPDGLQSNRKS